VFIVDKTHTISMMTDNLQVQRYWLYKWR